MLIFFFFVVRRHERGIPVKAIGAQHKSRRCGRVRVKVNLLHGVTLACAVAYKVAKVLERNLAFTPDLEGLLATDTKLLERACQTDAQVVCRKAQNLADGAGDASTVDVNIVDAVELGRDFVCQAMRQRLRNLLNHIGSSGDNWKAFLLVSWPIKGLV